MNHLKNLSLWLDANNNKNHFLFTLSDFRGLFPDLSKSNFKTTISRATSKKILTKVCRNIYTYEKNIPQDGLFLFHVAALMRANNFNYISLETTLSENGIISQIPINWISIMSSGRSNIISCSKFGTIEFVHTKQTPIEIMQHLFYDSRCGLWKADVELALKDMRRTNRNCDLIDWDIANEFI